ncbi:MAG: hypothetical protein Q9213_006215 [Squamulea squamosa]
MAGSTTSPSRSVLLKPQIVRDAEAQQAVISVLFTVAMLATFGRLAIRFRYQNRLFADDYVLLFGCASLIAAFTLTNVMLGDIYLDMSLILGPLELVLQESTSADFVSHILSFQQLSFSAYVLCWATIFSVKMSFLLFFRQLLYRLSGLMTFWKVTVGSVIVSGIFCVCSIFIACPHFGVSAIQCTQVPGLTRMVTVSQLANALNMLTDLLIIAIPIKLLWSMKIRLNQRIVLGTFLCLSVCMFAICLIRAIGYTIDGNIGTTFDVQWALFWHITEANVAVTVVSLMAFRSLYGIKTLQQEQNNQKRYGPWLSSFRKNMLNRRKQRRVDEFGDTISDGLYSLPSIPGATLTGMSSIIGRISARSTKVLTTRSGLPSVDEAEDEKEPGLIKVVNEFDLHQSVRSYV